MENLVQKFFRVDNSTTWSAAGTGLGLAISKALVEFRGGTIWVESKVGKGSTFSFTIHKSGALSIEDAYDIFGTAGFSDIGFCPQSVSSDSRTHSRWLSSTSGVAQIPASLSVNPEGERLSEAGIVLAGFLAGFTATRHQGGP